MGPPGQDGVDGTGIAGERGDIGSYLWQGLIVKIQILTEFW